MSFVDWSIIVLYPASVRILAISLAKTYHVEDVYIPYPSRSKRRHCIDACSNVFVMMFVTVCVWSVVRDLRVKGCSISFWKLLFIVTLILLGNGLWIFIAWVVIIQLLRNIVFILNWNLHCRMVYLAWFFVYVASFSKVWLCVYDRQM